MMQWTCRRRSKAIAPLLVLWTIVVCIALAAVPTPAVGADWVVGDVFVAVGNGFYMVYTNSGLFKENINDGLGGFTTGCAFNPSLTKLYTTNFTNTKVKVYDNTHPHNIGQTVDTAATSPGGHSESIVFDASGNFYVGHPDGNDFIHKYNAAGTLLTTFGAAIEVRGTDWIDLAADQGTIFYTSEGRKVKRFNVGTNTQLSDFATLPGSGVAFALRLLPPGDGSGGLLVADSTNIKRLNGSGAVVQTYDASGELSRSLLNLAERDGTASYPQFTAMQGIPT
jgi:DNA-binding beta-propeller fold protein YncE